MKRRDILKISAAAAAAPAAIASQQQLAGVALAAQQAARPAWKPAVLDAHQNETVIALTDWIIPATDTPGAKAAEVNRFIDLMLQDGPATERQRFLEGLGWLDGFAISRHHTPFVKCAPDQQRTMLETLDRDAEAEIEPGHRFFRMIKSLTSQGYYSSKIGFEELNKGGRVPASYASRHKHHA